ncbi:MAG: methyltransferase domain-containing protein [Gemmatimonadetes bacterium]|nr:methyltransferase domain-containing protein [Gemmatimonadota bacterium]
MSLDYFVVGPRVALQTRPHGDPGPAPRLDLSVLLPPNREIGWLRTRLFSDHVLVDLQWHEDGSRRYDVEAVRLAARVLARLTAVELRVATVAATEARRRALEADGFVHAGDGRWHLMPGRLATPGSRAATMDELYADPFRVVWNFEARPWDTLVPLLAHAARCDRFRVLDIGCGFGKNARLLERLGMDAHGIDVSPRAIAGGAPWLRHPERFAAASLDALPHDDASFDAVLDVGCLHCLPGELREPGVAEVARVMKPGGWLFSRVLLPRDQAWLRAQAYVVDALGLEPPALVGLLEPYFEVAWTTDPQAVQVRARRRGAGA